MRSSPEDGIDNPEITSVPIPSGRDDELVAAAKNGNEPAFEELTRRHRERMFSLALRYARVRGCRRYCPANFPESVRAPEQVPKQILVFNLVDTYRYK